MLFLSFRLTIKKGSGSTMALDISPPSPLNRDQDLPSLVNKDTSRIPPSLLKQCLDLCAKYIHYIDSLVDFPEDFSVKILKRAVAGGLFDTDSQEASAAIRVYGETDEFFCQMRIPNLLVLNEFEQSFFSVMQSVRKLDLSGLAIDDNHDILEVIPECNWLQVLILEGANIKDKGMRRLTYPCFDGRKLPNLFYLDISGLDLSDKFMKTLHHLPQLRNLVLYCGQQKGAVPGFKNTTRPCLEKVATSPVLVTLVLHWTRITQNRRRAKLVEKTGFYGNHVVADSRKLTLKVKQNKVMLNRIATSAKGNEATNFLAKTMARRWKKIPQIELPKEINFDIEENKCPSREVSNSIVSSKKRTRPTQELPENKKFKLDAKENCDNSDIMDLYR